MPYAHPAAYTLLVFYTAALPSAFDSPSLHDALPISFWLDQALAQASTVCSTAAPSPSSGRAAFPAGKAARPEEGDRSEEHTSELQSPYELVCRLLLEKKKTRKISPYIANSGTDSRTT